MKYKIGDKVRIKSLDWYNENKGNDVKFLIKEMSEFCGKIMTIKRISGIYYIMEESAIAYGWTDEMIEGFAEELLDKEMEEHQRMCDEIMDIQGIEPIEAEMEQIIHCPEGYIFKDEYGNVINATKIVLEKKKKEYPKSYEECCKVLGFLNVDLCFNAEYRSFGASKEQWKRLGLMNHFYRLLICRDAYWTIAGEQMGLGKPWEYDCKSDYFAFAIIYRNGWIQKVGIQHKNAILAFPTAEMRDAFKENFDTEIEFCKEFL